MNPLERIQQQMKIVRLMDEVKKPLPTTFRTGYTVQLPIEVAELLRDLRTQHNIRVNEKLEASIKKIAVKLARDVNQTLQKTKQNHQQGVDSQPRTQV